VIDAGRERLPARTASRVRLVRGAMLPYYAFRAAEAMVRVVPHRAAYRIGDAAAALVTRTQPRRFDGLRGNLRHVLPDADEQALEKVTRSNVRNLVRAWIDVLEMRHRADFMVSRLDIVDLHHLNGALDRGHGAIVVSLHLGSWEHGIAAYNRRYGSMALLAEALNPPQLFERIAKARGALGVQVIPVDIAGMRSKDQRTARLLGASALRDVYRVLRNNGCVAIAMDRDIVGNGEPMAFFGEAAPIPVGVVELAVRTGAALVPIVLLRNGHRVRAEVYPEVGYDVDAPREPEVRRVAARVLRLFETIIRDHPDQWHVLDPIWPADATGA
jgi:phosphatidylinositol dimannoside acyltransferase